MTVVNKRAVEMKIEMRTAQTDGLVVIACSHYSILQMSHLALCNRTKRPSISAKIASQQRRPEPGGAHFYSPTLLATLLSVNYCLVLPVRNNTGMRHFYSVFVAHTNCRARRI